MRPRQTDVRRQVSRSAISPGAASCDRRPCGCGSRRMGARRARAATARCRQGVKRSMTAIISSASSTSCRRRCSAPAPWLRESCACLTDVGGDLADTGGEEVGRAARRPVRPEVPQPFGLDVERQDHRLRSRRIMRIGVRLPGIDQDGAIVGERHEPVAHENCVSAPSTFSRTWQWGCACRTRGRSMSSSATLPKRPRAMRKAFDIA